MSACAMQVDDPGGQEPAEVEATAAELVGFRNYTSPEIGIVGAAAEFNAVQHSGGCTGTAIAPYVVLTAGHCMDVANYFYTIEEPLHVRRFTVRARWSHPTYDIGLLRLWDPVPFHRPIKEHGPVGVTVAVWGFGGNDCDYRDDHWAHAVGAWVKRIGFFKTEASGLIDPGIICPGDSGGPIVDVADGHIFGVVQGSWGTQPGDTSYFTATNRPGVWNDLLFHLWVWANP